MLWSLLGLVIQLLQVLADVMKLNDHVPLLTGFTATAAALAIGYGVVAAKSRRASRAASQDAAAPDMTVSLDLADDDEPEIPDEYRDPITFSVIEDPVVLCATGQVYDYKTIKEWFMHGNRLCPKTNVEVLDVQLTRLPWLKDKIHQWMTENHMPIPHEPNPIDEIKTTVSEEVAAWMSDIKSDTGYKRASAVAELVRYLRKWEDQDTEGDREEQAGKRLAVRKALMDDMVWMIRYGDTYLQGVAATLLACCEEESELQWLAAAGVFPLVALLHSHYFWTQEASMQILYNIGLEVEAARKAIWVAGGVHALVSIIALDRKKVGYHRDRAAILVATLAESLPEAKAYLQQHGAEPLKRMLLHSDDRWEKRDAAFALLSLELSEEQLGAGISSDLLEDYRWCSQQWLDGMVSRPQDGLTAEEVKARQEYTAQEQAAEEEEQQQEGQQEGQGAAGAVPAPAVRQEQEHPAAGAEPAPRQRPQQPAAAGNALGAAPLPDAAARPLGMQQQGGAAVQQAGAAAAPQPQPQPQAPGAAQDLGQAAAGLPRLHEGAAAAAGDAAAGPPAAPVAAAEMDVMGMQLLRGLQAGEAMGPGADGTAVVHARGAAGPAHDAGLPAGMAPAGRAGQVLRAGQQAAAGGQDGPPAAPARLQPAAGAGTAADERARAGTAADGVGANQEQR